MLDASSNCKTEPCAKPASCLTVHRLQICLPVSWCHRLASLGLLQMRDLLLNGETLLMRLQAVQVEQMLELLC